MIIWCKIQAIINPLSSILYYSLSTNQVYDILKVTKLESYLFFLVEISLSFGVRQVITECGLKIVNRPSYQKQNVYKILLSSKFLCLKLYISITPEPIEFSILGKLYIFPETGLDYFFFRFKSQVVVKQNFRYQGRMVYL